MYPLRMIYVAVPVVLLLGLVLFIVLYRHGCRSRQKKMDVARTLVAAPPRKSAVDMLVIESYAERGKREKTVCAVELVPRFGGWVLGGTPDCNMQINSRCVCSRHVRISLTETRGRVLLEHLKSGRPDSVGLHDGRWLPVGKSEELVLPTEFVLGDVRVALSLQNRKI